MVQRVLSGSREVCVVRAGRVLHGDRDAVVALATLAEVVVLEAVTYANTKSAMDLK